MNQVILVCRPVKDPEIKKSESGKVYCRIRVAVDGPYRGKNKPREAQYFNVVCFDKLAQTIYNNLGKGALCIVVGSLSQDTYIDKMGTKRESVSIKAKTIEILEWLRKTRTIDQLENLSESELLVPREITKSLFRQLEVSVDDEDMPDDIVGKDPFENDSL